MVLKSKTIRFYWWFLLEFAKKHIKIIIISFLLTFFVIISLISFSPYIASFFFRQKDVIGVVGQYNINTLPTDIIVQISHGLIYFDQDGAMAPALASSWEVTDGGREFRFHLKQDLVWDDGKKFTTRDIHYSFPDVETKIIDDNTIYFHLKKPLPVFPVFLTRPIVRPPLHGVVGLYKVSEIEDKFGAITTIGMTPNKDNLPPLTYRFYKNEGDLINAYKLGEINQMKLSKKSIADAFVGWKNTKIEKTVDYSQVLTLFFNLSNERLAQKEVRQAIAQTIPLNELSEVGELATGPIPPTSWAYSKNVKKLAYNPEVAKKTLSDFFQATSSATLNFQTSFEYFDTASAINSNLKDAGVNTKLNLNVFGEFEGFDLLLAFWKVPEDPDQYFFWHSTQKEGNITNYRNVKIDKLLEDGRNTLDVKKRKEIYTDFQKVLTDDIPAVFLYYPNIYSLKRK